MQYCVYYEISTPLTAEHFINAEKGSIYGLDSSPQRFSCTKLRPRTPIKNFYQTNVISRLSKTMAECAQELAKQQDKKTGTNG